MPDDVDPNEFTLENHTKFFVDQGKTYTKGEEKTGFLPDLINELKDQILATVDPDEVQQKILQLAQDAVEEDVVQ